MAGEAFTPSDNDYDWLGPGIYFWESNPKRALEWAGMLHQRKHAPEASDLFVVGAVIDLGFCLDLLTSNGTAAVKAAHRHFEQKIQRSQSPRPRNTGGGDLLPRRLDCAVLRHLHAIRNLGSQTPFDTVRGVFIEGAPIYADSGFREQTHIQICVCNPATVNGVFRVSFKDLE